MTLLWIRCCPGIPDTNGFVTVSRYDSELLSLLKDAETGQRDYVIAGITIYFEPYTVVAWLKVKIADIQHLERELKSSSDSNALLCSYSLKE
jgi:CHASE3 domain sensor protein